MNSDSIDAVFQSSNYKQCEEMRLVLQATGIPAELARVPGGWTLLVESNDRARASAELEDYQAERVSAQNRAAERPRLAGVGSRAVVGAFLFCLITSFITWMGWSSAYGIDWESRGVSHAAAVTSGSWWLCVTALTLHADFGHLFSNLTSGVLLGIIVSYRLGAGFTWLLILLAGTIGNALNAFTHNPDHYSLGASTATIGALGLAVALALRPSLNSEQNWMKRWSPLFGGAVLLAMQSGIGQERVDVSAHFWGFLAGFAVGLPATWLPDAWVERRLNQGIASLLTLLLILTAWGFASAAD